MTETEKFRTERLVAFRIGRVFLADRVLVMTRRPATIVEDLTIPFARPRPMAIGESREFNEICGHLRERIEENHFRGRRADPAPARPEFVA